jgi:hypothetical protein
LLPVFLEVITQSFDHLRELIQRAREEDDFAEADILAWKLNLEKLKGDLVRSPSTINLINNRKKHLSVKFV